MRPSRSSSISSISPVSSTNSNGSDESNLLKRSRSSLTAFVEDKPNIKILRPENELDILNISQNGTPIKKRRNGSFKTSKSSETSGIENKTASLSSSSFLNESYEAPRTLDDYEILENLGTGSQGSVFKAKNINTGEIIVLKEIYFKRNKEKIYRAAQDEIRALTDISCHPLIVCYYGNFEDGNRPNTIFIELEYIEGLTLNEWADRIKLTKPQDYLYEKLNMIMYDLCTAIEYIHDLGFIHRDIKPDNILIRLEGSTIIKGDKEIQKLANSPQLLDFGLSCLGERCNGGICCRGEVGTLLFMPPETYYNGLSFFTSDVWSLGATIFYLIHKDEDLFDKDYRNIRKLFTGNKFLDNAVNSCLFYDYKDRKSIIEIKNILSANPNIKRYL